MECVFCRIVARELPCHKVLERGLRLISNVRGHDGQEMDHLHLHLVGGTRLGRMLPRWL